MVSRVELVVVAGIDWAIADLLKTVVKVKAETPVMLAIAMPIEIRVEEGRRNFINYGNSTLLF